MASKSRKSSSVLRPGKAKAAFESYAGPIQPGPDTRDQTANAPSLGNSAGAGRARNRQDDYGDGRG